MAGGRPSVSHERFSATGLPRPRSTSLWLAYRRRVYMPLATRSVACASASVANRTGALRADRPAVREPGSITRASPPHQPGPATGTALQPWWIAAELYRATSSRRAGHRSSAAPLPRPEHGRRWWQSRRCEEVHRPPDRRLLSAQMPAPSGGESQPSTGRRTVAEPLRHTRRLAHSTSWFGGSA